LKFRTLAFAVLISPAFAAAPAENTPPDRIADARLLQWRGDVQLHTLDKNAAGGAMPAWLPLLEGDVLETGKDGVAEISLDGSTLLHLDPASKLVIKNLSTRDTRFRLSYGILVAKVKFEKKEGDQLVVVTPSALAQVRGTEFVIEETGDRARIAVLDEGHVAVTAPHYRKEVVMHFNQEVQVNRGHSPENSHVLERLYHYKVLMSQMRQRNKINRKRWYAMTPHHRELVRAAWVKTHAPKRPSRRRRAAR
jgi:ferric-dicitrate binding protein FerR (iron transport regulator)